MKFFQGQCVVDAGGYIFNTEAHPIDPGALNCCRRVQSVFPSRKSTLRKFVPVEEIRGDDTINYEEIKLMRENRENSIEIMKLAKMREIIKAEKVNSTMPEKTILNDGTLEIEELDDEIEEIDEIDEIEEDLNFVNSKTVSPPPNDLLNDEDDDVENIEAYDIENIETYDTENENEFLNQSDKEEEIVKKKFEPQTMFENIRQRNLYPMNFTTKLNYHTLSCRAQPFLQRISIVGEFF